MDASGKGSPARRRIQSIEVGFRVIRALLSAQGPTPLRDIAAAAGMAHSKAHLYLASFVREEMAFQDPQTGHYGLGPFAVRLGLSAMRQLSIVDEARPFLRQLSDLTGCATYLSVLGNTGPAIVSKAEGNRHGVFSVQLGYVLPLTHSATGQIFLAHISRVRRTELLDREYANPSKDRPPVAREKLESRLSKVLKQGFATTAGQLNTSFVAASAPIFDYNGEIAAAMTILGPERYLTSARLKTFLVKLRETAGELSLAMGTPGPDETRPRKPSRPT